MKLILTRMSPIFLRGNDQADTKVYKIDDGYYGDNGTTIAAQYDSKEFNMQRTAGRQDAKVSIR